MVKFLEHLEKTNHTSLAENIIAQLLIVGCAVLVYYAITLKLYVLIAIPPLILSVAYVIFKPDHIIYLFVMSHFLSIPLYKKMSFVVSVPELMYHVLIFSFICAPTFLKTVRKFFFPRNTAFYLLIVLFVISIFSWIINVPTLQSKFILSGAWYIYRFTQLLLVFYIFYNLEMSEEFKERLVYIVVIFMALQVFVCVLQFYIHSDLSYAVARNRVHGTFGHHHAMIGSYALIPIGFALYRYFTHDTLRDKIIALVLAIASFSVIILAGARSALSGVILAGALYTVMSFRFKKIYFIYLLGALLLLILLYFLTPLKLIVNQTFFSQETHTLDASSASRFLIWLGGIQHFINADWMTKLFGTGIGSYHSIEYGFSIWNGERGISGAHNNYLHVLCEVGIVGLIVFLLLFWYILKALYIKGKECHLARMYFFVTIALLGSGLTQETFWFQAALGSLWLFYIFFLTLILKPNKGITE